MHAAQLFVAVLGASSYTYAEATQTQSLPDWTASHCRAFRFFGGVTSLVVCDNLKAGVTAAWNYDAEAGRFAEALGGVGTGEALHTALMVLLAVGYSQ